MNAPLDRTAPATASRSELANALRALAMDAVQKANSGHPGMPMGMAEVALALWRGHLRHNPANPAWPNRDRFVVSNGHGSMLLYALLHLTGYDLPMSELASFRQLHSRTPGHPEYGLTPGVETTTGPLGQGLANAVGMALAERLLAAEFNRPGFEVVDHRTYVFLGDGCLMEGISHEACSLAGTWGLAKLVCLYDDNGISIDGKVEGWFRDDTPKRFEAYGWNVVRDVDGHDVDAVDAAIRAANAQADRPTLICCKTVIGKGAPHKAGSADVHGAPLGEKEVAAAREALGWTHPPFEVPAHVYAGWDARAAGARREAAWRRTLEGYRAAHPELAAELERRLAGRRPADWAAAASALIGRTQVKAETVATRKASQNAIEAIAAALPELVGGSADLTHSNLTVWSKARALSRESAGNHIHYGVREFGMAAIANGMTLHGGLVPFCATFLVFSDYARNALRMAALMRVPNVFVFTHDSIGLGEDGPTHQPVEHAAALRCIPRLDVWRPCDATETAAAWVSAIDRRDGPTALLLSRQSLPPQARDEAQLAAIRAGGYVLAEAEGGQPDVVLVATGSEVALAVEARRTLAAEGVSARVVSMPSTTVFDRQTESYRDAVLPPGVPRVAVEAGSRDFWRKYVGLEGAVVGLDDFGESAPAAALFAHFDITAPRVAREAHAVLARSGRRPAAP